mgnify:CR=1 FL=1
MNLKRKSNWNLGCSLTLVVVLAAIFFFNLWAQNLGKYTLQPGESANFTVNPRTHDVEYYSELILEKKILIGLNYQVQEFGLRCMAIFFMMLKGKNLFEAIIQKMLMKSYPIIKKILN